MMPQPDRPAILIVDDMPANIQLLAEALRAEYRILVATNGPEALKIAAGPAKPDLILLDVMMPGMDGFEVCRRLKEDATLRDIPVIFVTARDDVADEARGLDLGAIDYIVKPFNLPVVKIRVRNHISLKQRADLLESLAHIDALTGIPNRRRLDETLAIEWRRGVRSGLPLAVLMVDIDRFKLYNDHFGHGAGDRCLSAIAALLSQQAARPGDLAARYGGEEFVIILPETDLAGARQIAERLRAQVEAAAIPHAPGAAGIITVSIGCASAVPGGHGSPEQLVADADARLYEAKNAGRNQVRS